MTVETNDTVERYTISGTGPYSFSFRIFDEDELLVQVDGGDEDTIQLAINTHYTVSGVDDEDGGTITLTSAAATTYAGDTLDIRSNTAEYQPTSIRNQGSFLPTVHEDAFDRLSRQIQDLSRKVNAAVRYPDDETASGAAPKVDSRKGRYLFSNAVTGLFEWVTSIATTALSQSIFNQYLADSDQYKRTDAEIAAGVTPVSYQYPSGNVWRYMTAAQIADVIAGTLALDVTAAFTSALASNAQVNVSDGAYRCDTAVTVGANKGLFLSHGATLARVSAASATTPVVYVLGIKAELTGGTISSEKASANGVVCLGHTDNADDRQAYWWRFTNCNVQGRGQAGDVGVNIPSGQATVGISSFNYFGCISNINIIGADIGLLFREYSNAHNATNLQFWECRTACLELRGAYANHIANIFFHTGLVSGLYSIHISEKTIGTQESQLNTIIGFTSETLGALDQSVVIHANATKNTIIGNSNVLGGFSVANPDNFVMLGGVIRSCIDSEFVSMTATGRVLVANGTAGTRDSFSECNNTVAALGAGGTMVLKTDVASGLLVIRNASDGVTALVLVDSTAGATEVSDPDNFVTVGADPGAASSQFWVECDGTSTRITNRYAASKSIDVLTLAAS